MNFNVYSIIGLQFGSEGKGSLAGYLAYRRRPRIVMSNWSPNAGHTFRVGEEKLVRRMVPIGAYTSPDCKYVLLGPGSIIDPERLIFEVNELPDGVKVVIHPAAAVVMSRHVEHEKAYARIGSTMKGSAAAAISRMERDPKNPTTILSYGIKHRNIEVSTEAYHTVLRDVLVEDLPVQIEGCQGFSLSMYHGFYPYTTSRDTTINQLLADVAMPRKNPVKVYGSVRTFPIRVANRAEGTSGPCYPDQRETSFEELGQPVELTTVTQLPRRIFTLSDQQIREAVYFNGVDAIYLSFCDYVGREHIKELTRQIEEVTGVPVAWRSWGPKLSDMEEIKDGL